MRIFFLAALSLWIFTQSAKAACPRGATRTALMVVDMQPIYIWRSGFENLPGNREKVAELYETQIRAIKNAMSKGWPIAFVIYENEGAVDPRLTELVQQYQNITYITKDVDGLFSNSNRYLRDAELFLERNDIGKLVIMGANGGACVKKTIEGAIEGQRCAVDAYTPGIADFNQSEFIYPYSGYYMKMLNWCMGCNLREVQTIPEF